MKELEASSPPEAAPQDPPAAKDPFIANFPEEAPPPPCSVCQCTAGHSWPVTLQLVKCGGCGTPVVVRKQENCPVCNEPTAYIAMRLDQLIYGQRVVQHCKGEPTPGAIGQIRIKRTPQELEPPMGEVVEVPVAQEAS